MTETQKALLRSILQTLTTVSYSALIGVRKLENESPEVIRQLEDNCRVLEGLVDELFED